ncbi:hypothetical protein ACVWY3_002766 [Bradyrhizobium sp. USDA 4486]
MSVIERGFVPGRSAAPFSGALQSRGPRYSAPCAFLGPGSAQQRKSVEARPGHEGNGPIGKFVHPEKPAAL